MDGQGGLHLRLVLVGDQGGLNSALSGPVVVTLWRGFFLPVFAYTRVGFSPPSRRSLLCHYFYQTPQTQYLHRLADSHSILRTPRSASGWRDFAWRSQCLRHLAGFGTSWYFRACSISI